jgi:hypothetical protein
VLDAAARKRIAFTDFVRRRQAARDKNAFPLLQCLVKKKKWPKNCVPRIFVQ